MGKHSYPSKLTEELPKLLGKNLLFLKTWAEANEEQFEKVMNTLAEEKPDVWASIYLKVQDKITPPKENKTTTNLNININKDIDKLQALAGGLIPTHSLESADKKTTYADYEEVSSV